MTDTSPYARQTVATVVAALAGSVGTVVIGWALVSSALNGRTVQSDKIYATSTAADAVRTLGGVSASGTVTAADLVITNSASLPGTLTATVPVFTTGALVATSTFTAYGPSTIQNLSVTGTGSFVGLVTFQNTNTTGTASFGISSSTQWLLGQGNAQDFIRTSSSTIDVDSLTAWSTTSARIGLAGAKIGDVAWVSQPYSASGTVIQVSASVVAADNIDLHFYAATSSAFDPQSAVISYGVLSNTTN